MLAEIFFIDHQRLKQEEKSVQSPLTRLNKAVNLWESSTQIKINDIAHLKSIANDPEKVFCDFVMREEKGREKELRKFFGERANLSQLVEQIYLPQDFSRVKVAMEEISKTRWEMFDLVESQVILSQAWHDRLLQKCYYVADTPQQKARLEYANKMLDFLNKQVDTLLEQEIKSDGRPSARFDKLRKSKSYHKNMLPVGLRFVGFNDDRTIEIDPDFVIHGFASFIPEFMKHTPLPEFVPIDYRIVYVRETDGSDQKKLIIEGSQIPTDWLRQSRTTLLPEIYHIINGKIVKTDKKGKRYPDHPLVEQK